MASRALGAARPITTDSERASLKAEMVEYRLRSKATGAPECLRWLRRQARMLHPEADKAEFLLLIDDAFAKFGPPTSEVAKQEAMGGRRQVA